MKRTIALLLSMIMVLSLVACGNVKNNEIQETANSNSKEDYNSTNEEEEIVKSLTLDEAQIRLVYAEGSYLLLAYYGPQENLGIHYCNSDGSEYNNTTPFYHYWEYDTGWRLIQTDELPDGVTSENVGISITDYNVESKPNRIFSNFGEPVSHEELAKMGVSFIEDLPCYITTDNRVSYGDHSFMFTVYFQWMAEARKIDADSWPFAKDNFSFFTKEGIPLEEAFSDYEMEVDIFDFDGGALDVKFRSKNSNEVTNKAMCDEVRMKEPYMIYTADDGSTIRFELFEDYNNQ